MKISAKKRNVSFFITYDYILDIFLKQNKKCALSGLPIKFWIKSKNSIDGTASLDRIDSTKGYVKDNVQWIHKDINYMKMDIEQQKFLEYCNIISQFNKNENYRT